MPDESHKDQPVVTSWKEYQERQPDEASIVENFMSYRELVNYDRSFYDHEFYQEFQKKLGGEDWLNHEGVKWYEKDYEGEVKIREKGRSASDAERSSEVRHRIKQRSGELETWQQENPELYQGVEDIIQALTNNRVDQLDSEEVQPKIQASLFHFKALLLAVQIGKDKSILAKAS